MIWLTVSPRPKAELSVLSSNKWIFKIINKRSLKWKSPCFNSSFNIKITFYVFTNTCSKSSTVCIPDENIVTLWLRSSLNKSWWANDCDRSKNILIQRYSMIIKFILHCIQNNYTYPFLFFLKSFYHFEILIYSFPLFLQPFIFGFNFFNQFITVWFRLKRKQLIRWYHLVVSSISK